MQGTKKRWLASSRHEGSSNYRGFFHVSTACTKGRPSWAGQSGFCSHLVRVPRGLCPRGRCGCVRAVLYSLLLPTPSFIAGVVLPGRARISAALLPALPLKLCLDSLWAPCSSVPAGEPAAAAARDGCAAFLIPVQAFMCMFCVNPGTSQLWDCWA